jgi:predicted esterase
LEVPVHRRSLWTRIAAAAGALLLVAATIFLPTAEAAAPTANRLDVGYTNSAGTTSEGHIFAAGLDWTKPVGLMIYADGSGEYGLENPNASYLLDADGTTGLVEAARRRNLILVTPEAPGGNCPNGGGECWYQASNGVSIAQKTRWAHDFAQMVRADYNESSERIILGGYSSGAQHTTEYLGPQYGEQLSADLMVAISYGGSPKVTPNYSAAFKANTPVVWDVGSNDSSYTTTSSYGVKAGYNWYRSNGFATTELNVVAGLGHSRSDFDLVMAREVDQHIPSTSASPPPSPTPSPTPTGC